MHFGVCARHWLLTARGAPLSSSGGNTFGCSFDLERGLAFMKHGARVQDMVSESLTPRIHSSTMTARRHTTKVVVG